MIATQPCKHGNAPATCADCQAALARIKERHAMRTKTAPETNGETREPAEPAGRLTREQGQRCREVWKALGPEATFEQLSNHLAEDGISITRQFFWNNQRKVFGKANPDKLGPPAGTRKKRTGGGKRAKPIAAARTPAADESPILTVDDLAGFVAAVKRIGGAGVARQVLEVLV